jgi:hypothetical protein
LVGETAFVLARAEAASDWRYCGVARWLDAEDQRGIPALDFTTWRALGKGRDCSRRLPSPAGGIWIDGGEGGFARRQVTNTDLAYARERRR